MQLNVTESLQESGNQVARYRGRNTRALKNVCLDGGRSRAAPDGSNTGKKTFAHLSRRQPETKTTGNLVTDFFLLSFPFFLRAEIKDKHFICRISWNCACKLSLIRCHDGFCTSILLAARLPEFLSFVPYSGFPRVLDKAVSGK